MYTLDQIRTAIQNAKAAGDEQAVQVLATAASQLAMQQAPDEQHDPSEGASSFRVGIGPGSIDTGIQMPQGANRVLAGVGRGLSNVARHAGNIVGLVPDQQITDANQRDAALMDTTGGQVGNFIGETAAMALPTAGAATAAGRIGARAATALANPITRGAFEGAIHGGIMSDPGEKGGGTLAGGALGAMLPAAMRGGGKLIHGMKRTPEAQALLNKGVDLTPGQMNPGGMWSQLEETWQSLPLVGPAITSARDNAKNTFQHAVMKEGAAPGAQIARGEVDDMLSAVYKSFEPLYDAAKGFPASAKIMNSTGADVPLLKAFHGAAATQSVRADDAVRKSVSGWLRNQLSAGVRSSDDLISMRSAIRAEARNARRQADVAAAELLDHAEDAVTNALKSQLPKNAITALQTADSKYGTYKLIEDAVFRTKDMPGGFTASKLSESVAQASRGAGKGAYARGGGGPLRDLAHAGTATLNVRVPQTGARIAAIGIPAMGIAATPAVGVPIIGGMLGMTGTEAGRKFAQGMTKPQQLAQALLSQQRSKIPDPAAELFAEYLRRASVAGMLPRE